MQSIFCIQNTVLSQPKGDETCSNQTLSKFFGVGIIASYQFAFPKIS